MAYKGDIPKGSSVETELSVGNGAGGSALLSLGFSDNDGGEDAQSVTVAPNGSERVSVQTNPKPTGILRVVVDFNSNSDTGRLVVTVNGKTRHDESVTGDTSWSYSLV
jgi:hypothetical protein